ncbi:uncharacterized protein LOC115444489 isoform X2 [Manduca sexta]|uniref:uncharacterized protein LOC115444489 isoform X2 n=1 Tax=Manduca sexta TaxID=7130 RepID=UPI00188F8BC0|nr:uncharacterized protein LOC115444489 isoform X2 [Manduca sexta]
MATEQEVNMKLVREVKKYPCLYDYNVPDYGRKDVVEKAWLEIGKRFNIPGADCKEKWTNIRNVFVRSLRAEKNGSGANKRKPYYLKEVMQFTVPFIKIHPKSKKLPIVINEIVNIKDGEDSTSFAEEASESQYKITGSHSIYTDHNPLEPTPSPQSSVSLPTPSPPLRPEPTPSPTELSTKCRKRGKNTTSVDEDILEHVKSKRARRECHNLEQQPRKMFLLSLLPDVECMNERQMRKFKTRVTQLIENILEDQPSFSENLLASLSRDEGHVNTQIIKTDVE